MHQLQIAVSAPHLMQCFIQDGLDRFNLCIEVKDNIFYRF